jgi:hypothetical protein
MQVTTIGLDLAKHVFQIHGIDAAEKIAVRRQLRRGQTFCTGVVPENSIRWDSRGEAESAQHRP